MIYFSDFAAGGGGLTIPATYQAVGGGTFSTSAFASKGLIVDVLANVEIGSIDIAINDDPGSDTYKIVIALLNASNVITSILGTSPVQAVTTETTYTFTLASRAAASAGQRIAVILVRTDGAATAIARLAFRSTGITNNSQFAHYGAVRYASNNPTLGDNVLWDNSSAAFLTINYWR